MNTFLLHIETATKVCSVCISENGVPLSTAEIIDEGYVHGEMLTVLIEKALEQAKFPISSISGVSISAGPGSYTGLRIGLSTAKGLCFALGIPLIGLSTLEILANGIQHETNHANIVSMIDARRMEAFTQVFRSDLTPISEVAATIIDETTFDEFRPLVYVGDAAEKVTSLWTDSKKIKKELILSASLQAPMAFERYLNNEFEDLAYFAPNYFKEFMVGQKG